ncbi:phage minor capsid protein [Clostridium sp. HBUAS56010]|uniref:phage minor capsid protein n=1 Tax=Clostridium sp. HBUAS56010 TaxID=2571127 RepID=UPI0011783476|nr:phage minor capsid protein [Clostridium sp. HBUAS56010]
MLTPEYLQRVAEQSEEYASRLRSYIISLLLRRIGARLGRGAGYLFTASDKWQIGVLQEAGELLEDIQKQVTVYTKLQQKEVKSAMEEAGIKALQYDDKIYHEAGLNPTPLKQSPVLVRQMQREYEATNGEIQNFTRTTAVEAQKLYINECDNAYRLVTSGAVSYNQAVQEAISNAISDGGAVKYPTGHKDTLETAVARSVRTGISQATGSIQLTRMIEMDWDIILTSAHLGARTGDGGQNPSNHLWWQGQFFSRTGRTKQFPDFIKSTGYGTITGLCGINCRHSFGPGDGVNNPFADLQTEDNERIETLNKKQRALERRIRKTKQELVGMKAAVDSVKDEPLKFELQQEYDRKAALLRRQNAAYNVFCKDNDLKKLTERLNIAKWNREQAAAANGAATRYNNARK